ncbi:MAG: hypothetical protein JKY62_16870 [Desulfocapsa sp.]|nr:hypothetical protein [Desulfocapsa sp.]
MLTTKGKVKGYGIVMMANNMPRIDNPRDVPQEAWDTLTLEQKNYANAQVQTDFRRVN